MADLLIHGGTVYTPIQMLRDGFVLVEGGRITDVQRGGGNGTPGPDHKLPPAARTLDVTGHFVVPGFVDLHVNGGGGGAFDDSDPTGIRTACEFHARGGTTTLLPTLNTAPPDQRQRALETLVAQRGAPTGTAEILGVYLEGPYYAPEYRGAHREDWLTTPNPDADRALLDQFGDLIKVFSLAPELPGALELIRELSRRGIVPAVGHSGATEEDLLPAIDAGLRLVTHLYCAQSTFHRTGARKRLGVAETALLHDDLSVEIIPDGWHLSVPLTQLILKCKRMEHVCLVTDAAPMAGLEPGRYEFLGTEVLVEDGVAWRPDKQRFAGSLLTMAAAVRHLVQEVHVSLCQALSMASLIPARMLHASDRKGRLVPGADADVVVLNGNLEVQLTLCRGVVAYATPVFAEALGA